MLLTIAQSVLFLFKLLNFTDLFFLFFFLRFCIARFNTKGSRLCQATVTASTQKILNAYGPIPVVYRENKIEKMRKVLRAGDDNDAQDQDPTPALIVLVVKASVLERIMGPLTDYIRKHDVNTQAKIFSRVVC